MKSIKVFRKKKKNKKLKKDCKRYQNFSEEEKGKKRQYYHQHTKTLSEDQKQSLIEYGRNYYITDEK